MNRRQLFFSAGAALVGAAVAPLLPKPLEAMDYVVGTSNVSDVIYLGLHSEGQAFVLNTDVVSVEGWDCTSYESGALGFLKTGNRHAGCFLGRFPDSHPFHATSSDLTPAEPEA